VKAKTKKTKVAFTTVRKETKKLTRGATKVDTAGRNGVRKVSYRRRVVSVQVAPFRAN